MLVLRRENLKLQHVSGTLPAQGSSDIEITIENDGTYSGYSSVLLLGYGFQFGRKFLMVNKNSTNKYVITSDAFADGNDISFAILLVSSKDKIATNQLIYSVNKTPYRTVESKKVDLWRDNLEAYVDAYLESIGAGGLPQPYTLPIATSEILGGVKPVAKTDKMTQPVGVDENGALFTQPTNAGSTITTDPTLSKPGQAADAKAVGDQFSKIKEDNTNQANTLWVLIQKMVFNEAPTDEELNAFKNAFGIGQSGGEEEPDTPIIPDEPDNPTKPTLTSITATYNGGNVLAGTELTDLVSNIVVTAKYNDGSTQTVTGYELSGEIVEGSNTIVVTYQELTTTFTVVGFVENETENNGWVNGEPYSFTWSENTRIKNDGTEEIVNEWVATDYLPCKDLSAIEWSESSGYGSCNCFYDENKNFLYTTSTLTFTLIPRGVAYARFTPINKSKGVVFTPHKFDVLGENTVWESGKKYNVPYIEKMSINASGVITTGSGSWWGSGLVFCYGATNIEVVSANAGNVSRNRFQVWFYDSEKAFISKYDSNVATGSPYNVEVPSNAKYFCLTRSDGSERGDNNPYVVLT